MKIMKINQASVLIAFSCILGNANAMDAKRDDLFATIQREGLFKEIIGYKGNPVSCFTDSVKRALAADDELALVGNIQASSKANQRDMLGQTILHETAAEGSTSVLKALIERLGARVQAIDASGLTPLHTAAKGNSPKKTSAVLILLDIGKACPNDEDLKGNTPLHFAAHSNNVESVKLLLNAGARVNVKNDLGYTPLDLARITFGDSREVIQVLREAGAQTGKDLK